MATTKTPPPPTDTLTVETAPRSPRRRMMLMLAAALIAIAALVATTVVLLSDSAEDQVEETVLASIEAENSQDVATFLSLWTDEGLESYDVGSREEIEADPTSIGEDEITDVEMIEVTVDGDTARAVVDGSIAPVRYRVAYELVQVDGDWKLNGFEFPAGTPELPAGVEPVSMQLTDFEFVVDDGALSGDFQAVSYENVGSDPHEIALGRVTDESLTGDALVEAITGSAEDDGPPEGIEEVGFLGFAEPGAEGTAVLDAPLDPGRYVMVCFVSGDDGVPHVAKGMLHEFEVN